MAAISQKASPGEVLPLLARNVIANGYQDKRPTEYLILVNWYLDQARELQALAGTGGEIRVSNCEEAKPLLAILGYRLRQPCGPDAAVETANANRAFLTIDSGFPLADLEETLRGGKPFVLPYFSTKVPVLFKPGEWLMTEKNTNRGVLDSLLRDPALARLYWALSNMDSETSHLLWQSIGPKKLIVSAPVLDFFGSQVSVRGGRVLVPGGAAAEPAWRDLVGANPKSPAEFVGKMLLRDDGWLTAYFDALSRADDTQQAYFTESGRLKRFYEAFRGPDISPTPTRHSFRPDQGLFFLVSRLQLDPSGQPHLPGNLALWKDVMRHKSDLKLLHEWGRKAGGWNNPEQVVEGMFGISRLSLSGGPLQAFLSLTEIDRGRAPEQLLSAQTERLLADKFERFGDQYPIFAEFHELNDLSVTRFLAVAESLDQIPDLLQRTDALGMFQANVGLWQILARQGEIPDASLNDSWQKIVNPFASVRTPTQTYAAGRTALAALLGASTGRTTLSQDQFLALLAGPNQSTREGQQLRSEMASRMRQAIDDQRLVSMDTLVALGDGLNQMAKGKDVGESLLTLAGELREFEMPKPLFTTRERTELASGLYSNRHTVMQMRTDLTKVIKAHSTPAELTEAQGLLAPFLRDTLVGLNYAYYEPPGAQMLHHNPLFVRSHDFSGGQYSGEVAGAEQQTWHSPRLFGQGWTASGGAHLIGSLADLPYVLAKVEEDFIVPQNVQSLIWEDLVPGFMSSAVVPRWWSVSRSEMHAVALYQRTGEEILTSAAQDEAPRQKALGALSARMIPQTLEQVELALRSGHPDDALAMTTPAQTLYLAKEFRLRYPSDNALRGLAGKELDELIARYPIETSWDRISDDFGVPHPALAQNNARELMSLKPIPAFLGYSSRLLAESWDSNNLYWARLADELGYSPMMLNQLVPQLTKRMVEQTFASHLEDWPAVLRAMRETGEEFRQGKIAGLPKSNPASRLQDGVAPLF
ncbi:MAG: hypothetical protein LAO19_05045 [Acidobacteriia bacterium]|nr:hypothetical protein [Terriglobia bacterium]